MASLTFTIEEQLKSDMEHFPWVNWSEVNREELNKKRIFEEFIKTGTVSDEDQNFCDKINWDPIDELEVREEYIKKLKKLEKEPPSRMNLEKLDKLLGLK